MLQDPVATEIIKIEVVRERVIWTGPDGLGKQQRGITVGNIEPVKHCMAQDVECDLPAVAR